MPRNIPLLYKVLLPCLGFLMLFNLVSFKNYQIENKLTKDIIETTLQKALAKYKMLAQNTPDSLYPRTVKDGAVKYVNREDWTSGFPAGTLWYLYQDSNDKTIKALAEKETRTLEPLKNFKGTHDLGFMVYCPFGNAYKSTGDKYYQKIYEQTAHTLALRYNKKAKCIRSWDFGQWQCPVIIDNMMNLELLFEAAKSTKDTNLYSIAINHANTTMKNHFRKDFSSYHVVNYDTTTGLVISKQTHQGFSDSSAWARGQAWGFYGFTTTYRYTKDKKYLIQAQKIADFIINHPNMPNDGIPYWDYNAPGHPNEPRDVSAAAIFASGLIEFSSYIPDPDKYLAFAEKTLLTMSSTEYFNGENENNGFLLKHATGHKPAGSEIDGTLNYADYYFIEALLRFKALYPNLK
jgi:unsaturated chondroitin disaccharide hydrolase